jgi:hypothetical protein
MYTNKKRTRWTWRDPIPPLKTPQRGLAEKPETTRLLFSVLAASYSWSNLNLDAGKRINLSSSTELIIPSFVTLRDPLWIHCIFDSCPFVPISPFRAP